MWAHFRVNSGFYSNLGRTSYVQKKRSTDRKSPSRPDLHFCRDSLQSLWCSLCEWSMLLPAFTFVLVHYVLIIVWSCCAAGTAFHMWWIETDEQIWRLLSFLGPHSLVWSVIFIGKHICPSSIFTYCTYPLVHSDSCWLSPYTRAIIIIPYTEAWIVFSYWYIEKLSMKK